MIQAYRRPKTSWLMQSPLYANASAVDAPALSERINKRYDSAMYSQFAAEYYDYSGFHNYGYWKPDTVNQRQASENLVDVLVRSFPNNKGNILDIACGMGASTKRLTRKYEPSLVTGINISEKQLATCRSRAPGCKFLNMDATDLRFPDHSFENILCVEACFHFDTREKFLREAYRVLAPGGCLALSDILLRSRKFASLMKRVPMANFVENVETYRSIYQSVGFRDIHIIDARAQCWEAFRDHSFTYIRDKILAGEAPPSALSYAVASQRLNDAAFSNYLLVSARKPRKHSDCR